MQFHILLCNVGVRAEWLMNQALGAISMLFISALLSVFPCRHLTPYPQLSLIPTSYLLTFPLLPTFPIHVSTLLLWPCPSLPPTQCLTVTNSSSAWKYFLKCPQGLSLNAHHTVTDEPLCHSQNSCYSGGVGIAPSSLSVHQQNLVMCPNALLLARAHLLLEKT